MERQPGKADWRCTGMVTGVRCAAMAGIRLQQVWCADSWATLVSRLQLYIYHVLLSYFFSSLPSSLSPFLYPSPSSCSFFLSLPSSTPPSLPPLVPSSSLSLPPPLPPSLPPSLLLSLLPLSPFLHPSYWGHSPHQRLLWSGDWTNCLRQRAVQWDGDVHH